MNKQIEAYIREGRIPFFNGLLTEDMNLLPAVVFQIGKSGFSIEIRNPVPFEVNERELIGFEILSERNISERVLIISGEGSLGSDGFVLMQEDEITRWILLFDNSNPLMINGVDANNVIVCSDTGLKLSIGIHSPTKIEVL